MRVLWLSLLLAGLCQAKEKEAADNLQTIEGRRLEGTGADTTCDGCSASGDKRSSSVLVPGLNLPEVLGDKTGVVQQALSTANDLAQTNSKDDLRLIIGNLISYITSDPTVALPIEQTDPLLAVLASLVGMPALTVAKLGSVFALMKFVKTSIAELIAAGLEVANIILSIIAVGALIGYIVENDGRLGVLSFGLTGPESEDESRSSKVNSGMFSRSFMDSPAAQGLTNLVYEAINKYD